MRPLKPLLFFAFLACITPITAQTESESLKRPALSEQQIQSLKNSLPERISFEMDLIDSLLCWTENLECTYRIAGFLSSTNDQLLCNRAHLLEMEFLGNQQLLLVHLEERLSEILADSGYEHLLRIKAPVWEKWLQQFVSWVPQLPQNQAIRPGNTVQVTNPFKHFSYHGIPNQF